MMTDDSRLDILAGLTCRVWDPPADGAGRTVILLHGRGGDENSMAVFRTAVPSDALVISPRAPLSDPQGGLAWIPPRPNATWPAHDDFSSTSLRLSALVGTLRASSGTTHPILMVGFSQGAAAAAAFALQHRSQIAALALLAGFVAETPMSLLDTKPLLGLPVFLAFGTQDELVPIQIVRQSTSRLAHAGASMTTCEAAVGHKVSAACLRALRDWLLSEGGAAAGDGHGQGNGGKD